MKNSYRAKDNICPFLSMRTDSSGELHLFRLFNIHGERLSTVIWDKNQNAQDSENSAIDKLVPSINDDWVPF